MKSPIKNTRPGFTLVELMTVVTIIAILAGLVVVGMEFANQRQATEKAKVQIALLSKAIEEYKVDMGAYPGSSSSYGGTAATGAGGDYSQVLYITLFKEGYDYTNPATPPSNWTKSTKIYLTELDPRNNKQGWVTSTTSATPSTSLKITDPWGSNYLYRVGVNAQNPDFDLWSKGKDGKTNTTNPSTTLEENQDDIRNF
jgi:prepilin-type N-terminal cleavage/methylation domain-containing protein